MIAPGSGTLQPRRTVDVSVVTLNAGRDRHLLRLAEGIARSDPSPSELVVVAMGSAHQPVAEVQRCAGSVPVRWVQIPSGEGGRLPLAAARNAGARSSSSPDLLFLDVDCIPAVDLVGAYAAALSQPEPGVVCGPVRWLERFWDHDLDALPSDELLHVRSAPHPVRPVPVTVAVDDRHELLWSLAFGVRRVDLERIGGFDEAYLGYGAEDTDLGFRARAAELRMRWLPSGTAFHQWHRVSDPPVEHVDAIVVNARRFHDRWGVWPMDGWLSAFADAGLVEWRPDGGELRRTVRPVEASSPKVVSIPATHPYTRRVLPDEVACDTDPTVPWWPHPALEPRWVEANLAPGDVVHLHFGFEHRTPEQMAQWCRAVHDAGAALVATVHDIDNPHCTASEQADHHRRVAEVLAVADEVLTLTGTAAAEVARRWGRSAEVVPHPHVAAVDHRRRSSGALADTFGRAVVGVDLKSLRSGTLDLETVLAGLGGGARRAGTGARAWVEAGAPRDRIVAAHRAAEAHGVELHVEAPPDDAGLVERFSGLDVAVLPYRAGTHSGLLELCRDVGVRPVVPDHGSYLGQWSAAVPFAGDPGRGTTADALAAAIVRAVDAGPVPAERPGWRADQLAAIRGRHREVYARAVEARRR